jgi:hypothetical protein
MHAAGCHRTIEMLRPPRMKSPQPVWLIIQLWATFVWAFSRLFSASQQYFSLITNQSTVFSATYFQAKGTCRNRSERGGQQLRLGADRANWFHAREVSAGASMQHDAQLQAPSRLHRPICHSATHPLPSRRKLSPRGTCTLLGDQFAAALAYLWLAGNFQCSD